MRAMGAHVFRSTVISIGIALCSIFGPSSARALGLGQPTMVPVIGLPLRIEIPLQLNPGEKLQTDCASIALPHGIPDRQFFPAHARVVVDTTGSPRVVIASPQPVAEPLIEFRLTVGCNNELSRDFLILPDPPQALRSTQSPATAAPAQSAPSAPPSSAPPLTEVLGAPSTTPVLPLPPQTRRHPVEAPSDEETLTLSRDTNLNSLARECYPSSQTTRDEYRRLMAQANPALFVGQGKVGSVQLPAGTVLVIPRNLPPPEEKTVARHDPASPQQRPARKSTGESSATVAAAPHKDRLIIGGDRLPNSKAMNSRELSAAIERMERMVEDQGRTEVQIAESLNTVNQAFIEAKNYIQALEASQEKSRLEQRALQSRVERAEAKLEKILGVWELLVLIIASGGVGAALIALHYRLQSRRHIAQMPIADVAEPVADLVPAPTYVTTSMAPPQPNVAAPARPPSRLPLSSPANAAVPPAPTISTTAPTSPPSAQPPNDSVTVAPPLPEEWDFELPPASELLSPR